MKALSISLRLGKASAPSGANLEHNNREFIADNVDASRITDNVIYVQQDVRQAYEELFGDALKEYNERQKQPCRRINDYFEHVSEGKREEPFYEIIVQFGCSETAPIGSSNGELAKKMLDDYVRGFNARNSNMKIFNAVCHNDEASSHLHINFIPFYTESRQKGLSKGVSMRAALDEQGFTAKNAKQNRLVAWEKSELKAMEKILNRYGLARDVKGATYSHMTVEEYKQSQDEKKIAPAEMWGLSAENTVAQLQQDYNLLRIEKEKLTAQKNSPWKAFYYSVPEKQSFVQQELDHLHIPYRETENGLEAQECYVDEIRRVEKTFKAQENPHRDKLRDNIDILVMRVSSYDDVLNELKKSGCEVRQGKYVSVKPKFSGQFIRLKSLGEDYSEQAIRNRILNRQRYESEINNMITKAKNQDSLDVVLLKTVRRYTIVFVQGSLPMRKTNKKKPFEWTNDAELDRLASLNKKINAGANLDSLRNEFAELENSVSAQENRIAYLKNEIELFHKLYACAERCFKYGEKDERDLALLAEKNVSATSYKRLPELVAGNEAEITEHEKSLITERGQLEAVSDNLTVLEKISSGTFIQSLVEAEEQRRQSDRIPNGLKDAR
jgi:hypothetical protein